MHWNMVLTYSNKWWYIGITMKPYRLAPLPPKELEYDERLLIKVAEARGQLGVLAGRIRHINEDLLVAPLLTKEAVLSSKIEGTQASIEDVFRFDAASKQDQESDAQSDEQEIANYRQAMRFAVSQLNNRPLGETAIQSLHSILLKSVRGKQRDPGNYRRMQVYIGPQGTTIEQATYVPPIASEVPGLMNNLVKYIHLDDVEPLIQIGVSHYQFEAIHPFMDGNGRIGRLLIALLLYEKGILAYPVLYISEYFEKNRKEYYRLLNEVTEGDGWVAWLTFFLDGVIKQSKHAQNTVDQILALYERLKIKAIKMGSPYAVEFLDTIFESPVVTYSRLREKLSAKSPQTVFNLVDKFVKGRVLFALEGQKSRGQMYIFTDLLKLL